MNNEPVAWMDYLEHSDVYDLNVSGRGIPLYTHPHPDNLGLAESIIKQQQAEIEALHRFIDERGETGQLIIWKAQEK